MSAEIKITALALVGSVALGALLLYLWDRLYIKLTGKPASERVRERKERWNRPLTPGRFRRLFVFYLAFISLCLYTAIWTTEYKSWGRLVLLGWMTSCSYGLYDLLKRWRKQQADDANQFSGGAT
jgi:hypothetical protein